MYSRLVRKGLNPLLFRTSERAVVDVLERARGFLETHGWTQGAFARTGDGDICAELDLHAESWCAVGAVRRVIRRCNTDLEIDVHDALGAASPGSTTTRRPRKRT